MPKFQDLVSVVGTGNHTSERINGVKRENPDVKTNAWLVHQRIIDHIHREKCPEIPGAEDGAVWYLWRGTLSSVVADLRIATRDNEVQFRDVKRDISRFLRGTGNAACLFRTNGILHGNLANRPAWAVRAEFRDGEVNPENVPVFWFRWDKNAQRVVPLVTEPDTGEQGNRESSNPHSHGITYGELMCPGCGEMRKASHLGRHYYQLHADPEKLCTSAVKHARALTSTDLAKLLSDTAGGAVISNSFVHAALANARRTESIGTSRGVHGTFWYIWNDGKTDVPHTAPTSPPLQPADFFEPAPHAAEPASAVAATPATPPEWSPQHQADDDWEPASTPAPEPAAVKPSTGDDLDGVLDAIELYASALAASARQVRDAVAGITEENKDLRAYRDRVRKLLADE